MILDIIDFIGGPFDFFKALVDTIGNIVEYITSIFNLILGLITTIITMSITFFTTMPGFISMGLLSVFSLGIYVLILKIIKK